MDKTNFPLCKFFWYCLVRTNHLLWFIIVIYNKLFRPPGPISGVYYRGYYQHVGPRYLRGRLSGP